MLEETMASKVNFPTILLSSHSHEEYIEKDETSKLIEAMRLAALLH
ncbi:MAG: hypothetical protein NUV75_08070 [Gallionella sp.]|nr:hypothetical protein [Gallionella sp.]